MSRKNSLAQKRKEYQALKAGLTPAQLEYLFYSFRFGRQPAPKNQAESAGRTRVKEALFNKGLLFWNRHNQQYELKTIARKICKEKGFAPGGA